MKQNSTVVLLIASGLLCSAAQLAASPLPTQNTGTVNTDRADRDTTQKIRKAIMGDKTLSAYAHNVKILAHGGKVTLRGPVRSEGEKKTVAEMASALVGADNLTNELIIQPGK